MNSKHIDLLDFSVLPAPVYFRYADFNSHEYASAHRHPWGT
ncbi:AraC family transcriptional regulator, partial [Pseudomonas neuropathica]